MLVKGIDYFTDPEVLSIDHTWHSEIIRVQRLNSLPAMGPRFDGL